MEIKNIDNYSSLKFADCNITPQSLSAKMNETFERFFRRSRKSLGPLYTSLCRLYDPRTCAK